jgi:hypothetical protein
MFDAYEFCYRDQSKVIPADQSGTESKQLIAHTVRSVGTMWLSDCKIYGIRSGIRYRGTFIIESNLTRLYFKCS